MRRIQSLWHSLLELEPGPKISDAWDFTGARIALPGPQYWTSTNYTAELHSDLLHVSPDPSWPSYMGGPVPAPHITGAYPRRTRRIAITWTPEPTPPYHVHFILRLPGTDVFFLPDPPSAPSADGALWVVVPLGLTWYHLYALHRRATDGRYSASVARMAKSGPGF